MGKRKQKKQKQLVKNESFAGWQEYPGAFGIFPSESGVSVTVTSAMQQSAVYGCVRIIASRIASLPISIYLLTDDGRIERPRHFAYNILSKSPNPMMTAYTFWECALYWLLLTGNFYAVIERTQGGRVMALTPIASNRVAPRLKGGRLIYEVHPVDSDLIVLDQDDVLHISGLGWDGCKGMSVISNSATPIGAALAQDRYTAKFFANSARPDGVISYPGKVTPEVADNLLNYWKDNHQGIDNAHLPSVLSEGGEYRSISMSSRDSELLESRRYSVADIARIFGVPLHLLMETDKSTSWGSGLEEQTRAFVQYTLSPHLTRIEQELARKVIRSNDYEAEFNLDGLLRADTKSRHEAYQLALGGNQQPGWMTINEVIKLERLQPMKGGDELYKPLTGEPNDDEESRDEQAASTLSTELRAVN